MSEQTQQPPVPATPDEKPQGPEHHYHHAAEKTELEKWLTAGLKKIEPYSNQILMGFIGVTVVLIAVILWSRSSVSSQKAEWEEFVENRVPDDYMNLAKKTPGTTVGAWSLLQAGRGFLQEGLRTALTNREVSDARLTESVEAFEKLLKQTNAPAAAREEALFGLATAREVLNGDDTSQAIATYQKLIEEFPESGHKAWATQRVEALQKKSTQEFYAWFRQQDPKPSDRPLPSDLLPGGIPAPDPTNLELLQDNLLNLPSAGVGEANQNTVPSEEEMKKEGEEPVKADDEAPKSFPNPEKDDAAKDAAKKGSEETADKPAEPVKEEGKPKEDAKPAEPKAEEPKAAEPKAAEPKAEEPKAEEPKAEEPKAEEPKAETEAEAEAKPAKEPEASAEEETKE